MFPTQFHALFFFNNNPLCPVGAAHRHGVIQWGMKNLLVVTPQKKNDPPPHLPSSCQLSEAHQLKARLPEPLPSPGGNFNWLDFV